MTEISVEDIKYIAKQLRKYHFPENTISEQITIVRKRLEENPMTTIYLRIPDVWEDGSILSDSMLDFIVCKDPMTESYTLIYTGGD